MVGEYTFEQIQAKVNNALERLKENDAFLLHVAANERSISHKLAEYLQQDFCDWNVDCEYNRKMQDKKTLGVRYDGVHDDDIDAKTIFPDIIIHRRETKDNLLVIEIKKSSNTEGNEKDVAKLKAFTGSEYEYLFGLFLKIDVGDDSSNCTQRWFEKGTQHPESANQGIVNRSNLRGLGYGE